MSDEEPPYWRPIVGYGVVEFVVALAVTYSLSRRIVLSLLVAAGAAVVGGLFEYRLLTIGKGPIGARRRYREDPRLK